MRAHTIALLGLVGCSFSGVATNDVDPADNNPDADAAPFACSNPGDYQAGASGVLLRVVDAELDWPAARAFCAAEGARLAVLTTQGLRDEANALAEGSRTWAGLRFNGDGSWSWIDGTPADVGMPTWGAGKPDSEQDQQCAAMRDDALFDDEVCTDTEPFLCECPPSGTL